MDCKSCKARWILFTIATLSKTCWSIQVQLRKFSSGPVPFSAVKRIPPNGQIPRTPRLHHAGVRSSKCPAHAAVQFVSKRRRIHYVLDNMPFMDNWTAASSKHLKDVCGDVFCLILCCFFTLAQLTTIFAHWLEFFSSTKPPNGHMDRGNVTRD